MDTTTIPIHSFSALVTNSSSETYITCTKETVEAAKELLSLFLKQSGSPHTVDDIFTIKLKPSTEYKPADISITLKDAWKDSPAEQEIIKKIIVLVKSTETQEFYS